MYSTVHQGAYLFQGNMLVVPTDIPDSRVYDLVPLERIRNAFGALSVAAVPDGTEGHDIWSAEVPPDRALPSGWRAVHPRQAIAAPVSARRLFRAYHIVQWRRESVFCGTCGSRNQDSPAELARVCPSCGRHEYPRISPAIIVLVINDQNEALLAHNKNFAPGVYSLIAGFNEAGETLEMTASREVREEAGLEVRDIRYLTSQPWPFPNSLMAGFTARYAGGTISADGVEIEDARWFRQDNLPQLPARGSVSRYIIDLWLEDALPFHYDKSMTDTHTPRGDAGAIPSIPIEKLFESAEQAAAFAYAPYSRFRVGAALLSEDGTIYTGCNVENRSYGLTICAERNALALAVGKGARSFVALAVSTPDSEVPVGPCGACRQVLSEFMKPDAPVRFGGANGEQVDTTIGILYPYDSLQGFAPPVVF